MKTDFFVKDANTEYPFFVKTGKGCEMWSNDRLLHVVLEGVTVFNAFNNTQQEVFTAVCWMLYGTGWERGNNVTTVNSVEEYINEVKFSPYFTKAVDEWRQQNEGKQS